MVFPEIVSDDVHDAMGEAAVAATAVHNCLRGAMRFSHNASSDLSLSPEYAHHSLSPG